MTQKPLIKTQEYKLAKELEAIQLEQARLRQLAENKRRATEQLLALQIQLGNSSYK